MSRFRRPIWPGHATIPEAIGSAAGLHGFVQQGIGALCAALAGLGSNPALTAGLVVGGGAVTGVLAFTVADWLERRI